MTLRLTPAETILYRTGPNNISILFEARDGFDPARALFGLNQMIEEAERFHRRPTGRIFPCFGGRQPIHWPDHVCVLNAPDLSAPHMMSQIRQLALPSDRPLWRAVLVNPDGGAGWSGLALHFDHAIADGTRISRHITTRALPKPDQRMPVDELPHVSLPQLKAQGDPRLIPALPGLARLSFEGLARAVPQANGHSDALLRLGHRMLSQDPAFADLDPKRRDHAEVARIEALRSKSGVLGNRARMETVDLSTSSTAGTALFESVQTPAVGHFRMAVARIIPAPLLRRIIQREFSAPGVVLTVVPVGRKLRPLFGIDLAAIHPAAPAMGRPPIGITAVRTGDGFDVSVSARNPTGEAIEGLSERVAAAMVEATQ